MELKGKALFNLLRLNFAEDPSMKVSPWQVENYCALSDQELYKRLAKLGVAMDAELFLVYAESSETPEDLADCLWLNEEDSIGQDQAYLLLFELWRRMLPDRKTISIFCDELDSLIEQFDRGDFQNDEKIQEMLTELEDILDQAADQGGDPKEIFKTFCDFCAHELPSFLYDYIAEQIDQENELYASELLDGFHEFLIDEKCFDFLRAQLFASTGPEEANVMFHNILENLREEKDKELLFEIVRYLVRHGDAPIFMQAVRQLLAELKTEAEFQELVALVAEYYRCLDKEEEEKAVQKILVDRSGKALSQPLDPSYRGLRSIAEFIKFSKA